MNLNRSEKQALLDQLRAKISVKDRAHRETLHNVVFSLDEPDVLIQLQKAPNGQHIICVGNRFFDEETTQQEQKICAVSFSIMASSFMYPPRHEFIG